MDGDFPFYSGWDVGDVGRSLGSTSPRPGRLPSLLSRVSQRPTWEEAPFLQQVKEAFQPGASQVKSTISGAPGQASDFVKALLERVGNSPVSKSLGEHPFFEIASQVEKIPGVGKIASKVLPLLPTALDLNRAYHDKSGSERAMDLSEGAGHLAYATPLAPVAIAADLVGGAALDTAKQAPDPALPNWASGQQDIFPEGKRYFQLEPGSGPKEAARREKISNPLGDIEGRKLTAIGQKYESSLPDASDSQVLNRAIAGHLHRLNQRRNTGDLSAQGYTDAMTGLSTAVQHALSKKGYEPEVATDMFKSSVPRAFI